MHHNAVGGSTSSHCTCCHVCHASEKTSRREFLPCTTCTSIACRPCVEGVGEIWEECLLNPNWSCPKCTATCPCLRCRRKVAAGFLGIDSKNTSHGLGHTTNSHHSTPSASNPNRPSSVATTAPKLPKKRRDETLLLLGQHTDIPKRKKSPDHRLSIESLKRPKKKLIKKKKRISADNAELALLSGLSLDVDLDETSSPSSPSSFSEGETENDFSEELWNFQEQDRKRLEDLISRNQRCTEFIKRTEQLLKLIRTEQGNILSQLKLFRKMKGKRGGSNSNNSLPPSFSPSLSPSPGPPMVASSSASPSFSPAPALTTEPPFASSTTTTLPTTNLKTPLLSLATTSEVVSPLSNSGGGLHSLAFVPTMRALDVL